MTKTLKAFLRKCTTSTGTELIDVLHCETQHEAITHCINTLKLNPEYLRIVLHAGETSLSRILWTSTEPKKVPEVITVPTDPWSNFLRARLEVIHHFHHEQNYTIGQIMDACNLTPLQVNMLLMTNPKEL